MINSLLLFGAVIAYYFPFVWHPAAALTLNAYDLAEMIRVSPAVLLSNPPLLATFLLRAPLALLAILFALNARHMAGRPLWRIVNLGMAAILWVTLTPPLEYFRDLRQNSWSEINFRQWALLQASTLVILVMIFVLRKRALAWRQIEITASVLVIVAAVNGAVLGLTVLSGLSVAVTVGAGLIGIVALMAAVVVLRWVR